MRRPRGQSARVEEFVRGVGEPESISFLPSPFQLEGVARLKQGDVLVVAPTGSGKTFIAEQIFLEYLESGRKCWYTTPLKALSNQKYAQFQLKFGPEKVGLITGERKENQQAPLVVATTEVLRNLLYTPEAKPELAILDEVHYLSDEDRGVTWEEILILAPLTMRFLMLSATVSNADEVAGWLKSLGRGELAVVRENERPVPLRFGLLSREYDPLPLRRSHILWGEKKSSVRVLRLFQRLTAYNLLPAIIFMGKRAECDAQLQYFEGLRSPGEKERADYVEFFLGRHPYLASHRFLPVLVRSGVAAHHAGHLTAWKMLVEQMLRENLIRMVFATTTLAAGLDVPARTVVLPSLSVRMKRGIRTLSATEFHQMAGRAGRRGKDRVGFCLLQARSPRELQAIQHLMRKPPEPLTSSFRVTYYQILNLLDQMPFSEALSFVEKSLAVFQKALQTRHGGERVVRRLKGAFLRRVGYLEEKGYLLPRGKLTELGHMAKKIRQERCLYIVETLKEGLWQGLSAEQVAGAAAFFTTDRSPRELMAPFPMRPFLRSIQAIEREQLRREIEEPFDSDRRFGFKDAEKKAAAVRAFAQGCNFELLCQKTQSEAGDLQRLLLRTYELLQELEAVGPPLSERARAAEIQIYRQPIV